ncbi:hypothetical protein ALC62_03929, partial [Cyphomyrmex costatus]
NFDNLKKTSGAASTPRIPPTPAKIGQDPRRRRKGATRWSQIKGRRERGLAAAVAAARTPPSTAARERSTEARHAAPRRAAPRLLSSSSSSLDSGAI